MSGNLTDIRHSLNAGEVSPRMVARQDQNKYLAGCETMLNWVPLVLGGAYVRPGTLFVAETKTVTDHPLKIIRSFVASRSAAYTMELGHQYVRFFTAGLPVDDPDNPGNPLELETPWTDTDLANLFLIQSIDVCYLLHGSYAPRKITRVAVDEFTITQVNFNPPATLEEQPTGFDLGQGTLTPSAATGVNITFDSEFGGFLAADVGRIIVFGGSRAVITGVSDTNTVVTDIIDDFPDTDPIPAEQWRLTLSPQTTLDITNDRVEVGLPATLTAGAAAFRGNDLHKWITIFGGLVQIIDVVSSTNVSTIIRSRLKDITVANPDPTRAWTLEVAAWSATLGYPTCGCFFQERLWLCKGLTINGSVTGDYENFGKGGDDDAAVARTISDDDIDSIVWIKGDQELKIGTGSGVYQASPTTQNGALTPSSFKIIPIDPNGGARIPPLRVSPVLIYVDASRRELRELSYNFAEDNFKSPHMFRMAEHLMDGFFINELCYASAPDSLIYVVRNDGVLLGLVYEQVEAVTAWFRIVTDGLIKSVCVIPRPSTGKDWLWQIVERDGGTFVEHYEPDQLGTGREWNELHTDSAVVAAHDMNFEVDGLDHLEGKTVWVIGDGQLFNIERRPNNVIVSTAVVTDGAITLDPQIPVSKVEVGLDYDARVVPVEPQLPAQAGGPLIARGYAEIGVRIRRTLGLTLRAFRVNMTEPGDDTIIGEQLVYRKPYHPMDAQVPLQQGKKCVINLGYDPFARIEVRQSLPFPAEVLNVLGRLHIGDRWDCETYNDGEIFVPVIENPQFGALVKECGHTCPLGQFAQAIYDGSEEPAGPAIRVTAESGIFSFRGLVALYVPDQEIIALVLYQGENLSGIGGIVTSISQLLVEGDVLRIEADDTADTLYRVKLNDVTILSANIPDSDLDVAGACIGFVTVADVSDEIIPPEPDTGDEPDVIIVKAIDEPRSSNVVLADDTELIVPIGANENWVAHAVIEVAVGSATPDIQLTWAGPSGSTGRYVETYNLFTDSALAAVNILGMSTRASFVFDIIIQNGATPGNLSFQWAQNSSSADATTVKKGSAVYAFKQSA